MQASARSATVQRLLEWRGRFQQPVQWDISSSVTAPAGRSTLWLKRTPTSRRNSARDPDYWAQRLDGARDLYLLALALGDRPDGSPLFGRMIREARIHFAAVIEEARIAGLDTSAIAVMLGRLSIELADSIRPELWARVEQLLAERAARPRSGAGRR